MYARVLQESIEAPTQQGRGQVLSVCHIASGREWAGAEVQIATLLANLSRNPEVLLSAIFMSEGRLAREARAFGIEVEVIPDREYPFWEVLRRAIRFARTRRCQILHSHRYKENLLATLMAARCKAHLVRTLHGHPEPGGWKQWLAYAIDRATARLAAQRVVSVSAALTQYLKGHLNEERIAVIRNGVDLNRAYSNVGPCEAKRRLGIDLDALVIGTAARLEPVKRIDLFLSAAHEISRELPRAHFVIAGRGGYESPLRQMAYFLGLQDRVHFLGHRNDVYEVLAAFDVLLLASDNEGVPMVVLEAMAMGIPVVCRAVGGIPEVIVHKATGLLVPSADSSALADACISVLRDKNLRQTLTRAARDLVRTTYSAERNAAQVVQLYRSLTRPAN